MARLSSPIGPTIDVAAQVISRTVIGGGGGRGRGGAIVPVSRAIEPGALVAPPAPPAVTTQDVGFLQKQINALVKRDQEQIVANNNLVSSIQKQFDVIRVAVTDLGSNLNVVGKLLNSDAQLEQNQAKQEAVEQKKASEAEYRKGSENALEKKIIRALMAPVKAIGDRLQFTLANLMKFFGILFTGWLVDKVIDLFKANAEGNKRKFDDIKNTIIKNLLIAGGILTILNLGFFRIVATITNIAFKIGRFVIGNTIGRLFRGIASLAKKLGSAVAGMVGLGGATKATTSAASSAGGASRVTMGAGTAEEIAKAEGKGGNWLTKLFGGGAAAETKAASTAAKGGAAAAGKTAGRFIPGVNVAVSGTLAAVDFSQGDILGGALNTVGMVPGPIGWVGSLGRLGLEGMRMMGGGGGNTSASPPTTPSTKSPPPTSTTPAKTTTAATSITSPVTSSPSSLAPSPSPASYPQNSAIPSLQTVSQGSQATNQVSPQEPMVTTLTVPPLPEPSNIPEISTPTQAMVPQPSTITQTTAAPATSTPQTTSLPPPSPEMVKKFEMAWQYRNNGMARGRIVEAWNNMTPQQQQQAITWAKSKGYDWTEMKLTPKPVPATTSQPAQVEAPTSQTSGSQIETPLQPAKIDTLPVPPVVGPSPAPKPNVIYASSNTNQKQPQTPLKSGPASDVPFIPSSNPDNFYLLYSQVQYNVVM